MEARFARVEEAGEVVRLARLMFESMGHDASGEEWRREGERHVRERLGKDLAVFVVEDPAGGGLVSSAAGTINRRLPGPLNPTGVAGYIQWVATEPAFRRRGLGRLTMQALLAWFEAAGVPNLELHATSDGEALYRSLGFGESGSRALRRLAWEQPTPG